MCVQHDMHFDNTVMMDELKISHISAGFDHEAVLVDENSSSVLKYKTPLFR